MVLAFCSSSVGPLSIYQVSFHSLLYFKRLLRTSFLLQKLKRGSNPVNTGDRVMVLAFCNSPHGPLSVYKVSLNHLQYFERYAPDMKLKDPGAVNSAKKTSECSLTTIWTSPTPSHSTNHISVYVYVNNHANI